MLFKREFDLTASQKEIVRKLYELRDEKGTVVLMGRPPDWWYCPEGRTVDRVRLEEDFTLDNLDVLVEAKLIRYRPLNPDYWRVIVTPRLDVALGRNLKGGIHPTSWGNWIVPFLILVFSALIFFRGCS